MVKSIYAGTLHVLLWHYFSPEPYPAPAGNHDQIVQDLQNNDLLRQDSNGVYRPTERGDKYLEMLLTTPLPEKRWVDPRAEGVS